ncbi:MAG: hypothetical protein LBJ02_08780 [Bifidobacteriaceae bacterium]|jgi:hypothetical protein|nr:hypothetical protein [Bifidobacteriaceae bacterium]
MAKHKNRGRRESFDGVPAARAGPFSFARVEGESSIVRWYMSRHGESVLAEFPGLLARLAKGPAEVALIFKGDRAVALLAWRPDLDGTVELLADHAAPARGTDQRRLVDFIYGPDGPLATAGTTLAWGVAEAKSQTRRLRQLGYRSRTGAAIGTLTRLERPVGQPSLDG